jgi:peptide-methionine (S)-S-oxide reductase
MFQERLRAAGYGRSPPRSPPSTAGPFYYAEPYHQQYLGKNPNGYCGLGGTGVSCPIGLSA